MKQISTLTLILLVFHYSVLSQQDTPGELVKQAINYFTGNGVKKSLSRAEELADQAILAGARDPKLFSILKEASKKNFALTKDAKKELKRITIDPVKKPSDYCLVLDQLIENTALPDQDKNNLILYYLLFFGQERTHSTDNDLTFSFDEIHILNYGDPASLIGLMPYGDSGTTFLKDKCFTEMVCKAYLSNKKLYTLTEEDKALADFYSSLYNADQRFFTSREDLTKAKEKHRQFLQRFPNDFFVKTSLDNIGFLLANAPKTDERPRDPETVYFWEDSYYQQHKPAPRVANSRYPFWLKFDTVQSTTFQGVFITERIASYHDMFFSQSGDYLLVMDGPFYFGQYKAGQRMSDNERRILQNTDYGTVYNVVAGYPVVRMAADSRKMDSVLNLLELNKDNYKDDKPNISIPSDQSRVYVTNIKKDCGDLEHLEFHGGLHNRADTVVYSTGGYYKNHIDIFLVDTKTSQLIRQIRFNVKEYANLVGLEYRFSPNLSKIAIQSRYKYSSPSEEPQHDSYSSVKWAAIEILTIDNDNDEILALDDSQNQLLQTRYSNIAAEQAEERYRAIQENNRRLTGTMTDKINQMDATRRQLENESAADRDRREEQKWEIVTCPTCNGTGKNLGGTCFRCNGLGKIKIRRR